MRNDMPTEQEDADKTNEDDADDDIGKHIISFENITFWTYQYQAPMSALHRAIAYQTGDTFNCYSHTALLLLRNTQSKRIFLTYHTIIGIREGCFS